MEKMTLFKTYEQDDSPYVYEGLYGEILDISNVPGTHLMSSLDTMEKIRKKMDNLYSPSLYYFGEGGNHHFSLSAMMRIQQPFTLLVFDHHNDAAHFPFSHYTSCGSWIKDAFHHVKNLKQAIMIGVSEEYTEKIAFDQDTPITIFTEEAFSQTMLEEVATLIPTDFLYISVDKDVLSLEEVTTTWDQGSLSLDEVSAALHFLLRGKKLAGADVCGDIRWQLPLCDSESFHREKIKAYYTNQRLFQVLGQAVEDHRS